MKKTTLPLKFFFLSLLCIFLHAGALFSQVTINNENFENGFVQWQDGGANCDLTNPGAIQGTYSALLSLTGNTRSNTLDLTQYSSLQFSFSFKAQDWDNSNDYFVLEYSSNGGINYTQIKKYTGTVEITANNQVYNDNLTIIPSGSITFTNNAVFRIRNNTDSNGGWTPVYDYTYIDNILITGTLLNAPEIKISGNGNEIVDGDTTPSTADNTDFGTTNAITAVTKTFTIENTGNQNLNLTGTPRVNISGTNASSFSVATIPSPTTTPGNSTTFSITFTPSGYGTFNASVSIANNDGNENPYNFNIRATVALTESDYTTIYFEDFDNDDGGWSALNNNFLSNTIWTWGTNGRSGETGDGNYWYTDQYNNYTSNANTTVQSPNINLSGYENLTFKIDIRKAMADYDYVGGVNPWSYDTGDVDDGFHVQYSTNNGFSWTTLGSTGSTTYWYDSNVSSLGSDGWTDANEGYGGLSVIQNDGFSRFITASISLPSALRNNPSVRFRVRFRSDGSRNFDGANFDNITIFGSPIIPVAEPSLGPGNIKTKLRLWLKANEVTGFTDGDDIDFWEDEARDNDAVKIYNSNEPTYSNNNTRNINYNPVVDFNKSQGDRLRGKGGFFSQNYFIAFKPNLSIDNSSSNRAMVISAPTSIDTHANDVSGLGIGSVSGRYTNEIISHTKDSYPTSSGANATSYGRAYTGSESIDEVAIVNVRANAAGNSVEIFFNGRKLDNTTGQSGTGATLNYSEWNNMIYNLGAGVYSINGNIDTFFDGRIMEVISYGERKTDRDQQKIYSYLALKNGVSLHNSSSLNIWEIADQDYIDSDGNIIWDVSANSGFNYRVAGIGRDDNSGLSQKQSQSEHTDNLITMSLGERYTTNSANTYSFTNDKDFLIWGNDNGPMTAGSTVQVDLSASTGAAGLQTTVDFIPINRTWKVVETKQAGTGVPEVTVSIDETALSSVLTPPGDFLMFISNTSTFDPSAEVRIMKTNGSKLEATYDFDGTKYITFGYAPEKTYVRSIKFNGSTDYMDADDNLDLASNFTMSAWIRPTASGTLLSKSNPGFSQGYELKLENDFTLKFEYKGSFDSRSIDSDVVLPHDEWHHVAVSYNGTYLQMYIDGFVAERSAENFTPENNDFSFLIGASGSSKNPSNFFAGHIDEVRVWNTALSQQQIQYIMNQEIEKFSDASVNGKIVPQDILKNDVRPIPWSSLAGYYPMTRYTYTNVKDESGYNNTAAIIQLKTVDYQTAPLPYESKANGAWTTDATWLNNTVQPLPNAASLVDPTEKVDWNIVKTNHIITTTDDITLLALFLQSNSITTRSGYKMDISHYLELDGLLDLKGESQLVQRYNSELKPSSSGYILQRQQGTANKYNYNYWTSPVNPQNITANNTDWSIKGIFKDESTGSVENLWFSGGYDGQPTSPATISTFWLYKFANLDGDYDNWQKIGENSLLHVGEAFTMKGPGSGGISDTYNGYVFKGKPNNATSRSTVQLPITAGKSYLIGNPFPSALDANDFINANNMLSGTLYFWEHWGGESHNLRDYQGGYAMYNLSGGTQAMADPLVSQTNANGALKGAPQRYIPVGQGFFVDGDTSGNIIFDNSQRDFVREPSGSSVFFLTSDHPQTNSATRDRSIPNIQLPPDDSAKDLEDLRAKIRLGFDNRDDKHRQLLVTEDPNTTMGRDKKYDGKVYEILPDDMNWKIGQDNYVIQGIPKFDQDLVLPLMLKIDNAGLVSIKIDSLQNFPESLDVLIKDKVQNTYTNLRETTFTINLERNTYNDRFELVFKDGNGNDSLGLEDETLTASDISIFYRKVDKNIVIRKSQAAKVTAARLYNILGQEIQVYKIDEPYGENTLPVNNIATGTYLLKLDTNGGTITKKLIIN